MRTAFFICMEKKSHSNISEQRYTFKKEERLRSKKLIERLFVEGDSFLVYPIKVVALEIEFKEKYPAKAAFAVSKKLFRKAVIRNTLKRRMREAYRLNKHVLFLDEIPSKKAIMFIYISKEILPFSIIEKAMIKILRSLSKPAAPNP